MGSAAELIPVKIDEGKLVALVKTQASVDVAAFVDAMETPFRQALIAALALEMAADDFVDALLGAEGEEDRLDNPALRDRGIVVLDIFVKRAILLGRIPDDYVPDWYYGVMNCADRLQRAIVEGRTDDALSQLRDAFPEHDFLSVAAEKMLVAGRASQGNLPL